MWRERQLRTTKRFSSNIPNICVCLCFELVPHPVHGMNTERFQYIYIYIYVWYSSREYESHFFLFSNGQIIHHTLT